MLSLEMNDRIYECPVCKRKEDRDIHAANNMIYFYQQIKDRPGTDQTLKLVSYNSYKEFVAKQESTMSLAQCQFIHIDEIKVSNGLTYYYDHSKGYFVNEPLDDTDSKLELADDNDETYKRYKLYLELKKEFE